MSSEDLHIAEAIDLALKSFRGVREAYNSGNLAEAQHLYQDAIRTLRRGKLVGGSEKPASSVTGFCKTCDGKQPTKNEPVEANAKNIVAPSPATKTEKENENLLTGVVASEECSTVWSDITVMDRPKEILEEMYLFYVKFPDVEVGLRNQTGRSILLCGPVDSGKSLLSHAVAAEAGGTFYRISSPKMLFNWSRRPRDAVRELFAMARRNKPCVLFLDEVDFLISPSRSQQEVAALVNLINEFHHWLTGPESHGILLIGSLQCDRPVAFESPLGALFEKRIFMPLLDTGGRLELLRSKISVIRNSLKNEDYERISQETLGFNEAGIVSVIERALDSRMRRIKNAEFFRAVHVALHDGRVEEMFTACREGDTGATKMKWISVPKGRLLEPPLEMRDFSNALADFRNA